jgi:hypothetical protein
VNNSKYYVSFIDDFSRYVWIYFLKNKSNVESIFLQFQKHVENMLNSKIKAVQSDWGGEYQRLHNYFQASGISHHISCPHTHQQNGLAERKHRHIVETGLALLAQAQMPLRFWDDAFNTATFLINRMPSRTIDNDTPLHKLFGTQPNYTSLRVFGCACWPNLRAYNDKKLSFKTKRCTFLGYSASHKGYKCFDHTTDRVYISISEPAADPAPESAEPAHGPTPEPAIDSADLSSGHTCSNAANNPGASVHSAGTSDGAASSIQIPEEEGGSDTVIAEPVSEVNRQEVGTRQHPMTTRLRNNIVQPKEFKDGTVRYSQNARGFSCSVSDRKMTASISTLSEPKSFEEAVSNPGWKKLWMMSMQHF